MAQEPSSGQTPTQNTLVQSELKNLYIYRDGEVPMEDVIYNQGDGAILTQNTYIYTGTISETGTYTVQVSLMSTSNRASHLSVQVNGNEVYNFAKGGGGWSLLLTYDLNLTAGDSIGLYAYHDLSGESAHVSNLKFYRNYYIIAPVETPIKRVTIRPNGTEKQIRPAGWTPGANTIAYYPFENDRNDYSGNLYDVTSANNTQLTTFNGVKCLNLNSSFCVVNTINTLTATNNYTILGWFYLTGRLTINYNYSGHWGGGGLSFRNNGDNSEIRWGNTTNTYTSGNWNTPTGQWFMFALVADAGKGGVYKNTTYTQLKSSGVIAPSNNTTPLYIGRDYSGSAQGNGYVSRLIIEDKARTAQEVSDYYNQTKKKYGIS